MTGRFRVITTQEFLMIATSSMNILSSVRTKSLGHSIVRMIPLATVSLVLLSATNTFAAITMPQRLTTTTLTGTNGQFNSARYGYENFLSVQASAVGDVQSDFFTFRNNFQNYSATVTSGTAVLDFSVPSYVAAEDRYESPFTLTFGDSNLDATWRFAYEGGVAQGATGGNESFISQTQVMRDGQLHWALVFIGGGAGGVSEGGIFSSTVVLAGLWGATGTGAGSVEYSYNSAYYSILKNFTFDGTNTTFQIGTSAYVSTSSVPNEGQDPNIQMTLIGDVVVPAPGAVALIGLSGLLVGRRRRI